MNTPEMAISDEKLGAGLNSYENSLGNLDSAAITNSAKSKLQEVQSIAQSSNVPTFCL
jgi:hypothetical protein